MPDWIETIDQKWIHTLTELHKEAEHVAGQWDGDESGDLEDLAHDAMEVMELTEKLKEILEWQ